MPKDVTVESFELDHTIVKAPYVRLISVLFQRKLDLKEISSQTLISV